jgi:hypothetical protein
MAAASYRWGCWGLFVALCMATAAEAQQTWDFPRAQPFVDIPWQRRFDNCPVQPPTWGCEDASQITDDCGETAYLPRAHRKCGWYMSADFAPLFYDADASANLAARGPAGPVVLHTGDLQTEFNAGGKFLLGAALTEHIAVEGAWQSYFSYSAEAAERDNAANGLGGIGTLETPFSKFGVPPLAGIDNNHFINIGLRNQYKTGELNARYRVEKMPGPFDFSLLVGARYAAAHEQFNYHAEATVPAPNGANNDITVRTLNDMWGVQLGFGTHWLINERSWIDFEVKGALCNNAARQTTTYININENGVGTVYNNLAGANRTSFIGDLSLLYNYQLTRRWSFHAGYQATWLEGMALGVTNFDTNLFRLTSGPAQLHHDGTIVYHGPLLGLSWAQ